MLLRRGNRRWPIVRLTLMAIGALLGVEIFRRHGKHLVALDADAVHHALRALRRHTVRVVRRGRGLVLFRHAPILTQAGPPASAGPAVRRASAQTHPAVLRRAATLKQQASCRQSEHPIYKGLVARGASRASENRRQQKVFSFASPNFVRIR